jgi:long-chain fatty acid transport protein
MSRNNKLISLFGIVGMLLSTQAFASGFGVRESSALSTGRLHTNTARFLTPATIFFNPAGLSDLKGFQATIGGQVILASFSYEDPNAVHDPLSAGGFAIVPAVALSYGVTDKFVMGLGFNAPYGLTIQWPDDFPGNKIVKRVALKIPHITFAASYRISSKLSIGISGHYAPHKLTSVALNRVQGTDPATALDTLLEGTAHGFGGGIGINYRPTDSLFIGASYKSRMKIDFAGDGTFTCGGGACPGLPDQDISASTTMPDEINLGLGLKPNDDWYIAADVGMTVWSVNEVLQIDLHESEFFSETLDLNWKNAYFFRVGAEWEKLDHLKIRMGAGYETNPVPSDTLSPMLPDANRLVGTVGASFKFGSLPVYADLSYLFVHFMKRTSTFEDFPATYSTNAHLFGLNLRYAGSN